MPTVTIKKSDVDGFYSGTAGEFKVEIDRAQKHSPRSIDLVLLGLGTCTISTVAHFLNRKGLPSENLAVELSAEYDEKGGMYKDLSIVLHLDDGIAPEMRKVVTGIAESCRIHRTLASSPQIALKLAEPGTATV